MHNSSGFEAKLPGPASRWAPGRGVSHRLHLRFLPTRPTPRPFELVLPACLPRPPPLFLWLMRPSLCLADQQNFMVTLDQVLLRCLAHQQHWSRLAEEQASPDPWSPASPEPGEPTSLLLASRPPCTHSTSSLVFSCISHALQWISQGRDPVFQPPSPPQGLLAHPVAGSGAGVLREAAAIHVLVTGSLHLVGGVLKLLEPALSQ